MRKWAAVACAVGASLATGVFLGFISRRDDRFGLLLDSHRSVLPFGHCLVDTLGLTECSLEDASCHGLENMCSLVECADGNFQISKASSAAGALPLFHHQQCPGRAVQRGQMAQRDIRVAVCCLVEVGDRVLLTRRRRTLRAFPSVWVLPGGHVDSGETLRRAAVRELAEECGISVEESTLIPFALYESIFPVEFGSTPSRHHLVYYFRCPIASEPLVTCQEEEVDAWMWLDGCSLGRGFLDGAPCVTQEDEFSFFEVPMRHQSSGKLLALQGLPDSNGQYGPDRLSTGTKYVLKLRFGH
jgi:8-oxo-dGTP pyrophosphatase MutT (NUDIX family)